MGGPISAKQGLLGFYLNIVLLCNGLKLTKLNKGIYDLIKFTVDTMVN